MGKLTAKKKARRKTRQAKSLHGGGYLPQWEIPQEVLPFAPPDWVQDTEAYERDVARWISWDGPCGVPVSAEPTDSVREFLLGGLTSLEGFDAREQAFVLAAEALSERLFPRGWRFSSSDSSQYGLYWAYPPSTYSEADGEIEPMTTFQADTSDAETFDDCEFSIMVAGHTWEAGEWPVETLDEFFANIDAVERHRAGDDLYDLPFDYDGSYVLHHRRITDSEN
ncbi:hypothetical protein ACWDOP_00750 [Nocardia sp. NPDC003693]